MSALHKTLERLCSEHRALALWAFGSRSVEAARVVREDIAMDPDIQSDLDLGVLVRHGCSMNAADRVRLSSSLEDLFGVSRVDLVVLNEASAGLAFDVIKGELLTDLEPNDTARFEIYCLRRVADLSRLERARRDEVLEEGAS